MEIGGQRSETKFAHKWVVLAIPLGQTWPKRSASGRTSRNNLPIPSGLACVRNVPEGDASGIIVGAEMLRKGILFLCTWSMAQGQECMLRDGVATFVFKAGAGWEVECEGNRARAFNYPRAQARGKGALPLKGAEISLALYGVDNGERPLTALRDALRAFRFNGENPAALRSRFDRTGDRHLMEAISTGKPDAGTATETSVHILESRASIVIASVTSDASADARELAREAGALLLQSRFSRVR